MVPRIAKKISVPGEIQTVSLLGTVFFALAMRTAFFRKQEKDACILFSAFGITLGEARD